MGDDSPTNNIVEMVMAFIIGIIMLASVAIPIGASQIASLTNNVDLNALGLTDMYQTLLGVAIVITIVALIYGLVKYMQRSR